MVMMLHCRVLVDVIDHRRQRRGLAAAGDAADDDQTVVAGWRELFVDRRQMQLIEVRYLRIDAADGGVQAAPRMKHAAAEAVSLLVVMGEIDASLFCRGFGRRNSGTIGGEQLLRVLGPQRLGLRFAAIARRFASIGGEPTLMCRSEACTCFIF